MSVPIPARAWRVGDPVPTGPAGLIAWPAPDSSSPFYMRGPAVISFSGGRTSALMLFLILWAHGGQLPEDVIVVFANTGKEREETLRFVHECATRWRVRIHWIEYRDDEAGFVEVGYNSASRAGEPFEALIAAKGFLPNRAAPFCSVELKARAIRDFVRATFGWQNWASIVGLRHDEQTRVLGAIGRNHSGKDPWRSAMPLDAARITKRDVMLAWCGPKARFDPATPWGDLPFGFDLGLYDYEGNCDLCWKKGRGKRLRIIRDDPGRAEWWAERERLDLTGALFREDDPVAVQIRDVATSPQFPLDECDDADEECGFSCFLSDADQLALAESVQ